MQWNQAVRQLKNYSQTETIRESVITFSSTIINGLLGIIYYFYLARILTPESFGRSTIFISAVVVGFSICDFGLDQSVIRFKTDIKILANIVGLKILIGLMASVIFIFIFGFQNLFGMVGLGIASQLLFSLTITFLQSWQYYVSWSLLYVSTNLFRLLVAIGSKNTDPMFHVLNYIFVPFLGFVIFSLYYRKKIPFPKLNFSVIKKIFDFNIPLAINLIISAITSRIDMFFIASFQNFAQAGVYGLAVQIAIFPHLVTAFSAVIAPKFKSMGSKSENQRYLKKTSIFTTTLAILIIPALLVTAYVLFSFSGINILSNIYVLLLLFFGYAIFFASVPLRDSLLYYYGDSKIFLNLSVICFLLSIISGFILIRPFGPLAAATSFLVVQIISVIILTIRYGTQSRRSHHR